MRDIEQHVSSDFAKQITAHVAHIIYDDGVFRHVRCAKPGTGNQAFAITTWPGHLAISGDMGTFVFARLPDMFEFFRSDKGRVNYSYWAEKLVAVDKSGGYEQFSPDIFKAAINERLTEWLAEHQYDAATTADIRDAVESEVLALVHDGPHEVIRAAMAYAHDGAYPFADIYEGRFTEWTYHYAWCCHAIVWAIAQYDALVAGGQVSALQRIEQLQRYELMHVRGENNIYPSATGDLLKRDAVRAVLARQVP